MHARHVACRRAATGSRLPAGVVPDNRMPVSRSPTSRLNVRLATLAERTGMSASTFHHHRLFGAPPMRDIKRLHRTVQAGGARMDA